MRYLDVCSGISAPTQAWKPLGWECAGYFEIDPFACEVLAVKYPGVTNYGDLLEVDHATIGERVGGVDLLVSGSPCQGFSVAGKRRGLDDPRSSLLFSSFALARAVGARWIVWENVPGVLSDAGGATVKLILDTLCDLGYSASWRVLDARFFGVPQRRRRLFVVGYLGDWRPPAAVLFEPQSLQRDYSSRGAKRSCSPAGVEGGARTGGERRADEALIPELAQALETRAGGGCSYKGADHETLILQLAAPELADPITAHEAHTWTPEGTTFRTHNVVPYNVNAAESCAKKDHAIETETARCLDTRGGFAAQQGGTVVAFQESQSGFREVPEHPTLDSNNGPRRHCGVVQPVAFSSKDYGSDVGETAPTLRSGNFDRSHANAGAPPAVAYHVQDKINHEQNQTDAAALLRGVREAVGEEAFSRWGLGVLEQLLPPEVLRSALHGNELRPAAFSRNWLVDCALSRAEDRGGGAVQSLREAAGAGCPSQGREPLEQRAEQLGAYLSELSQPGPQAERLMRALWQAGEGLGALRQALSAIQEARRSAPRSDQPEHTSIMVRRLTPTECEFLMGMPRNYTLITRASGKPAADGPRYRALGNSMVVNVMRWIGERIAAVDAFWGGLTWKP